MKVEQSSNFSFIPEIKGEFGQFNSYYCCNDYPGQSSFDYSQNGFNCNNTNSASASVSSQLNYPYFLLNPQLSNNGRMALISNDNFLNYLRSNLTEKDLYSVLKEKFLLTDY